MFCPRLTNINVFMNAQSSSGPVIWHSSLIKTTIVTRMFHLRRIVNLVRDWRMRLKLLLRDYELKFTHPLQDCVYEYESLSRENLETDTSNRRLSLVINDITSWPTKKKILLLLGLELCCIKTVNNGGWSNSWSKGSWKCISYSVHFNRQILKCMIEVLNY